MEGGLTVGLFAEQRSHCCVELGDQQVDLRGLLRGDFKEVRCNRESVVCVSSLFVVKPA